MFGQNTKAIALLFGQNCLIFITFQSPIKINQFQFRSCFAHFWAKYQGYSFTFWPKLAQCHHFSMCNQNQSISISVIFRSFLGKIPRLQPYLLAKIASFSSLFNLQSKLIIVNVGHFSLIFGQNTKAIAVLFGQNWLSFMTFQCGIKINQCQFRSFVAHFWAKYQGYSLTFWAKLPHFHHFSISNQNQSISMSVNFRSFLGKIPRLQPYFLAKIASFSSLFNLQSKSINFNFGHFSLIFGQNTKAIALLFGQNCLIFITVQSPIKINHFQFRSFFAHLWAKYQGYSLTVWPKLPHFHHFSISNQNQSISISVIFRSFLGKIPRLQPYCLAKIASFSSLFNLQSKSINFNFGHLSLIFGDNTKAISLLFGQNCLIFITFQSPIKNNQFQFRSFFAHFWAKYQGYSLTFWPKLPHFHHFSISNQNQSISISVIFRSFVGKIPRLQPYFLAKIASFSSLFNLQSKSINFNVGHFSLIFGQNTKAIALLFGQNCLILITFQSPIKINHCQCRSFFAHLWAKYQGYSLTFWPKLPDCHHFSISNQNQSISISVIFRSCLGKIPRLQPYFLAKIASFSSLFNLQSKSINFNFGHVSLIFGQNTKATALLFGQNWLSVITVQCANKINQFQFRSFFAHFWAKYQGYSLTFWPKLPHFHHFSISNQNQSLSMSVIFRSCVGKIPRLQPYFLAKIASVSSLFNLQSKSINFNFGHFSLIFGQNTKAIAVLFGQNWLSFMTFQCAIKINQFQFRSFVAHLWAKYQGYSLTFWPKLPHFHHFSISNQNQSISISVIFRSFLGKIPRLQPYFLAKIASFSSLFNLQSKSIIVNVGHFSLICGQTTKAIALLFGQNCLIVITFQSPIKINQFQFRSFFAHFWAKYQGYSLTFWPKLPHFHHFSISNQNQSISISVIFRSFVGKIPRLQPYYLAKIASFSSLFNLQSKSINFNFGHFSLIFGQNTKAIALLFGQNCLIFITFQSPIKINQFQFRSFVAHFWAKYQGYSLTFWPKLPHFHHFSISNQNQSISISVIFRSFLGKIPRLQPYFLAKIASFSSLFNLQSKSINFNFGHFSLIFGQNTKATALLFGQNWLSVITFQCAIKINQFQFRSFFAHFWAKYQGYSLTFWPKLPHFHHLSISNQNQSLSMSVIFRSFVGKIPRLQPYFLAKIASFSSLFNLQSNSINFNFGHFSLIFGQNTKAIALLFGQNCLIFITFQSPIKINQFQFRSFFAHFWAKYQGYSLTFWPKLPHFHHLSISNQNQSISISVIFRSFLGKIPRLQPYVLAKIVSFSSFVNLQSKSIIFNVGHFSLICGQNTKAIALLFGQNCLIFITFQSPIKINQFQFRSFFAHFWAKYQGYSLTFWAKLPHFHHFSISNQNQSISISVICRSFVGKIPRLQPYFLAKIASFSSLFNLQSNSINFNFGHFSLIFGQNTKAIALLFGQNCLIFITFQSPIKINQFQFRSFFAHFWATYQGYSLTFWPKLPHFHHLSISNQNQSFSMSVISRSFVGKIPRLQPYFLAKIASFSSLFNLHSKSINFNFGHLSLIFGQNTKAIALLFGQNCLIVITFQSPIKINQCQCRSCFAHFWAKYQGYSLTFWPKLPQFHHFSISNENQSISISVICRSFLGKIPRLQPYFVAKIASFSSLFNLQSKSIIVNVGHFSLICGQNTKAIALLFGQNCLIFITFQSPFKINQFQFRSFFAHFWAKYQGYSLTFWPKLPHCHHFSISNQNQSMSMSVMFRSFLGKIPRLQPYLLAKIASISSLFNLQSKSINFNFGHLSLIFGQNTKAIALLFGQNCLIFIICQSPIKINHCQCRSFFAHLWAKYQGYSLTFWPKLPHFHHFSISNQTQSISISVIFRSFLGKIPRLQPYCLAKIASFSSLFNLQSKSINFNFGHFSLIFGQNTKAIALLFGQNCLIFIICQSPIKINHFQYRSFFAHLWAKYQGYSLTFWPKLPHFHHFSISNQNQSISISVIFRSFLGKIPRLQPYFLGKIASFSSLFNLQSKSINFNFGHLSLNFGQNTKAIALLFGQNCLIFITFQSPIKINQFQFRSFFAHFWAKYQGYSLTFWPKLPHFHHLSISNQNQSFSMSVISRSFVGKIPRLQPYFLAKIASFSSLFNLHSKSINFNFGHLSLIFGQNTKAIALLFGQNCLMFITFQSPIKINQFQFRSVFAHFWAKYQGYSLTCWPKLPHFHHFSISNQNQSISISVIFRSFLGKIPRLQPYCLAKIASLSSLFNLQSKSINFNFGHFSLIFGQNTKAIALLFGQNCLIFIICQSPIKMNQFQFRSIFAHIWAKYQGYSLTFWPKLPHFHHFSISNQNQSISISVNCRSFLGKIPRLQPYFLAKIASFSSLFNLQSKSINFNFGHFSLIFGQNTKAIALLVGQNCLIFITFQSPIKINQFQFRSFFAHFWAKYQGYSLTFWPKLPHFHHFSISNQNQSISISVIFRSFVGKIPRLQPYFLAKIASFSSFVNLQSKSINFNFGQFSLIFGQNTKAIALLFGQNCLIFIICQSPIKINHFQCRSFLAHFWAKYQGYSLTFWSKLPHFHHFSISNQNQSMSISVIFRSFLGKIPRLQPYFLAKIASFSSLFNLQSKSINFNFGHFSLSFGQNTKAISVLCGQYWLIVIRNPDITLL